ncbi:MAG: M20/M25/M40 family metallo-hydrolase, partial [Bacteroidota bacterium]
NGATNIIPDEVKVEGTFRTMDEAWRKEAHNIIQQIAISKAKSLCGDCEVNIMTGYPALVNDEEITARAKKFAEVYLGKENVIELEQRMTGEDFSFFAQKIPACFYRLGTGNKLKGITSGVHTPTFNIDESALKTGMGLMAWIAVSELGK